MSRQEFKVARIEDAIRLRRVQDELPRSRDLAIVRDHLEGDIGPTVSQRLAAKVLGVSHTALHRWIRSGDIPLVLTQSGRKEVPTHYLIDLAMRIDRDRGAGGRSHSLEPAMAEGRSKANRIHARARRSATESPLDPHQRASAFALAYHREIACGLTQSQVDEALRTVWRWRDQGRMHPRYADAWERILTGSLTGVCAAITDDSEHGRDLRQNSPFAGALSEPERNALLELHAT